MWTVKKVLQWTTEYFERQGIDSPRVDGEILLAKVLNCNRVKLYIDQDKPMSDNELATMHDLVLRRGKHEPMAYILGCRGFMHDDFIVNKDVLIPRPETELLVERVAELIKETTDVNVLDIGTGSGAVILSLVKLLPSIKAKAVDISSDALVIARANCEKMGLGDRVKFVKSDIYDGLDNQKFDVIISNPPYIPTNDLQGLDKDVKFEPMLALDGGKDGLDFYRRIINDAKKYLTDEGLLAFEVGIGQGKVVAELCHKAGFDVTVVLDDYAKIDRNVLATREGSKFENGILAITQKQ